MNTTSSTKSHSVDYREVMHTISPHLICKGALDAMAFYEKAFGARQMVRLLTPQGGLIHGSMAIGDSLIMLMEENPDYRALGPKTLGGSAVTIHLNVKDVDASFKQAVDAGATPMMPPADMFWGDRYSVVQDPFGHCWSIATHIRDVSAEELQRGADAMATNPDCMGSQK